MYLISGLRSGGGRGRAVRTPKRVFVLALEVVVAADRTLKTSSYAFLQCQNSKNNQNRLIIGIGRLTGVNSYV